MYLTKNLYWLRKNKGLTTTQTAEGCGIGRTTYMNFENGDTEPRASQIIGICRYFNISIDDFLTLDLENVHLNENSEDGKGLKIVHPFVHQNVHPSPKKEGISTVKEQTDLLILKQLNYIAEHLRKIDEKIDRRGN